MLNLQERSPTTTDTFVRVRIEAADPLVRAGLSAMLAAAPGAAVTPDADVALWDGRGTLPSGRVLALVGDGDQARAAWASGARGLLHRDASATQVLAAARAVRSGLAAVEPTFATALGSGPSLAEEGIEPLTDREQEVIALMAEGLSNKDIGLALGVTAHTAKFHVAAILGKLRAATRTEAVVRAARLGMLAI